MTVLALLAMLAAAPDADASAAEQIALLRARSNGAIAAHDYDAMRPLLDSDYTVLPGSSGRALRGEEIAERLRTAFRDPTFVTYVRTPLDIRVADSGERAAETGTWTGLWRKPDGVMQLAGIYQAMWVPAAGGWRLRNESFVTLQCVGSSACAEID